MKEVAAEMILDNWSVYTAVRACRRGIIDHFDCINACRAARKVLERKRLLHPIRALIHERPCLTQSQIERAAHMVVRSNTPLVTALNAVTMLSAREGKRRWTSTDMILVLKRAEAKFRGE